MAFFDKDLFDSFDEEVKEENFKDLAKENLQADESIDITFKDLDVNQRNDIEFNRVMSNASVNYDSYWDKNNPFLRVLLIVLGVFIVVGILYFVFSYFFQ